MSEPKKKILFEPFEKQLEFFRAVSARQHQFILYGGSIRGGKTYALLGLFIILAKQYPGSKYLVVRKDLERIRTTVLPTFNAIKPKSFTKKDESPHNQWTWTATNGSQIRFFGENIDKDPNLLRFRGLEYDSIGFEEMDVSEKAFEVGLERCGTWMMSDRMEAKQRGQRTPPAMVVGTSNPQQGWVKKKIYDKYEAGTLNPSWMYIPSKVYDNKYIDKEWIENRRKNMSPLRFKMMVEGDWSISMNDQPFFYNFNSDIHIGNKDLRPNPWEPLWFSFDFNIKPTTVVVGQKLEDRCLIYKVHQVNGGTKKLCEELIEHGYLQHQAGILVTGDFSGNTGSTTAGLLPGGVFNTDYNIIAEELFIEPHDFVDTRTANRKHEYSRRLCNTFFARVPFKINPTGCEELVIDLQTAQATAKGKLKKDRDAHKQDVGDAFRYLINSWFMNGISDINDYTYFLSTELNDIDY